MYLLDTDILSLLFRAQSKVLSRFAKLRNDQIVAASIISEIEILRGRFDSVLNASQKEEWRIAQEQLLGDREKLSKMSIVYITETAIDVLERLQNLKGMRKVGRADLLIASIALVNDAILVTRNLKDFKRVPDLKIENWAD